MIIARGQTSSSLPLCPPPPPRPSALPPAAFPAFSPCLGPFALRRPLRSSFNLLLLHLLLFLLLLLPSPLPRLPSVSLRSSYHNRRHPSCITCHFVPRRSLSRAAARQSRDSTAEPTMTPSRPQVSPGAIAGLFSRDPPASDGVTRKSATPPSGPFDSPSRVKREFQKHTVAGETVRNTLGAFFYPADPTAISINPVPAGTFHRRVRK